jgi:hypothetical protein
LACTGQVTAGKLGTSSIWSPSFAHRANVGIDAIS